MGKLLLNTYENYWLLAPTDLFLNILCRGC